MKISLKNFTKSFGRNKILEDIKFEFDEGKIYCILGRNGSGKTTLFNCISKEIPVDSGEILISDKNDTRNVNVQNDIGYVLSTPILPEFLTGYEFIKFYIDINKDKLPQPKTIEEYFEIINLNRDDQNKIMKNYSLGMKNKIQMLMFIISQPPVILLDEPLVSLDPVVCLEMKKILLKMKKDKIIIFSTHLLQLAKELSDEIIVLNKGNLTPINQEMLRDKDWEEYIVSILKGGVD